MRYPTDKRGLIISPYELGYTIPAENQRYTVHHAYYYSTYYKTLQYRSVFRNLIVNTYPMLGHEHNNGKDTLHTKYRNQPNPPSDSLMIEVVDDYLSENGVIHCVKENKTKEIYEIQEPEWICIKGLYRTRSVA